MDLRIAAFVRFVVHMNAQYDPNLGPRPCRLALNNFPLFDLCERSPQWTVSMVTYLPALIMPMFGLLDQINGPR
jgi:hypothetical protein